LSIFTCFSFTSYCASASVFMLTLMTKLTFMPCCPWASFRMAQRSVLMVLQ
jgi:hypothetical protein